MKVKFKWVFLSFTQLNAFKNWSYIFIAASYRDFESNYVRGEAEENFSIFLV